MGERVELKDSEQLGAIMMVTPDLVEGFCNTLFLMSCLGLDKEDRNAVDEEDYILPDRL